MATEKKVKKSAISLLDMAKFALEQSKIGSAAPTYLGPMVVQAPGAWSRVGPTWVVPGIGWLVFGPGLRTWGTSEGLAQLGCDPNTQPQWHAIGVSFVPEPDISFGMLPEVVKAHQKVLEVMLALGDAIAQ